MTVDAHLVALLGFPGLGPRRLRRLLEVFGEPAAVWRAIRRGRLDGIPLHGKTADRATLVAGWRSCAHAVDVSGVAAVRHRAGIGIIGPDHPDWPLAFVHDPEPPLLAFVRGDPALLSAVAAGIVGTRRCTAAGAATARELGRDLALAGVGVVSGLALGIDGAAHRGCLEAGGPAVGVVATGLDVVYPRRHAGLWEEVATRGVLVSEAPMGTAAERWRFPARNRLIAALASVVVVVESRRSGGSMLTVDSAAERDTDVLAVPGPVRSPASDGPNQLLSEGCAVARDATDVLVALGTAVPSTTEQLRLDGVADDPVPDDPGRDEPVPDDPVPDDPVPDDPVLCALSWTPTSLDGIVEATGLSFTQVAARLTTLELSGAVERLADGYQRRVS